MTITILILSVSYFYCIQGRLPEKRDIAQIRTEFETKSEFQTNLHEPIYSTRVTLTSEPRSRYKYHNYSTLESDLHKLNNTYPELLEVYTAQDAYGLPECTDGYKIFIVRITNESMGNNKPEVLFLGGHHGDEDISVEAPFYLIEYLVENYYTNPYIKYLVDTREIYVLPVVNPWGWENNVRSDFAGEDVNRDYPYTKHTGTPLTTVGARAVVEIMKRHIFILSLSWHSGEHLIYYAWGTPAHDTPTDESPDNVAFFEVAKQMSDFAGGENKYKYGPANQMFYYGGVYGAWSDYAYAASWDPKNLTLGHETPGAGSLALGIEISKTKKPTESSLGSANDVFNSNGSITGFIPQNIRMALVVIDLAEPYITWTTSSNQIPNQAQAGSKITLNWSVNGSFTATKTQIIFGTNPSPMNNYTYTTPIKSADRNWFDGSFSEEITLPEIPGDYYFTAFASVDQRALVQHSPEPKLPAQSFFVKQRTNGSWSYSISENTLKGRNKWYSPVIRIKVTSNVKNQIWITDYDETAYCDHTFNLTWLIKTDGSLNHTELYWGQQQDPRNNSEYQTTMQMGITGKDIFRETITLPTKPGIYYFTARANIIPTEYNNSKDLTNLWSEVESIEIIPLTPHKLEVSLPEINYYNGYDQILELNGIICTNSILSNDTLNDSNMLSHTVDIIPFDPTTKTYIKKLEDLAYTFNLLWSASNGYWYLPEQNLSSYPAGWYQVICNFTHRYGFGWSNDILSLEVNNWFYLEHIIIVNPAKAIFNEDKTLNITNVTAWCSYNELDYLDITEVDQQSFEIIDISSQTRVTTGKLTWLGKEQSWQALSVNLSDLRSGEYHVVCRFNVSEIGEAQSVHKSGDSSEFVIPSPTISNGSQKDEDDVGAVNELLISGIVFVIIIVFLVFLLLMIKIRKRH